MQDHLFKMTTKVKGQGPIDVSEASRQWHLKLPRGSCYEQLACAVIRLCRNGMPPWQAYSGLSGNKCPICSVPTTVEPGRSYGKLTRAPHKPHVECLSVLQNCWWPTRITTWQTVQQFEQSRSPLPCSTPKWTQSQLSSLSWFKKRVSHDCVDASYLKAYVLRAAFKDTNSLDYERSVFIGRSLFAKDSVMCSRYVMTVEIFEAARNKSKGKTGTSKAGTRARTPRRKWSTWKATLSKQSSSCRAENTASNKAMKRIISIDSPNWSVCKSDFSQLITVHLNGTPASLVICVVMM